MFFNALEIATCLVLLMNSVPLCRSLYNTAIIVRLVLTWFPNPPQFIAGPLRYGCAARIVISASVAAVHGDANLTTWMLSAVLFVTHI